MKNKEASFPRKVTKFIDSKSKDALLFSGLISLFITILKSVLSVLFVSKFQT